MNQTITETFKTQIEQIVLKHGTTKEALLPCIQVLQKIDGHISEPGLDFICSKLNLSRIYVHGVASFYGMLTTKKQGKFHFRVCNSLSCNIGGSANLLTLLEKELGIKEGETSEDGLFSLEKVACLGFCDKAPAVLVNEEMFGNLDEAAMTEIISKIKAKGS